MMASGGKGLKSLRSIIHNSATCYDKNSTKEESKASTMDSHRPPTMWPTTLAYIWPSDIKPSQARWFDNQCGYSIVVHNID